MAALTDIIPVPETGRLKSPQKMPYAQLRCEFESHTLAGTQGGWLDVRKVTIEVRGLKPDVVTACAAIRQAFNRKITLAYPSGAKFISFMPDGDAKLNEDPATKDGQDVWLGIIEANVFSARDD